MPPETSSFESSSISARTADMALQVPPWEIQPSFTSPHADRGMKEEAGGRRDRIDQRPILCPLICFSGFGSHFLASWSTLSLTPSLHVSTQDCPGDPAALATAPRSRRPNSQASASPTEKLAPHGDL